jgi:hypothetical protein
MYFYLTCEANGEFFGMDNQCMPAGYSVAGIVNDAKSAKILLDDAKVEFSQNGAVFDTAYSKSGGRYTVSVGEGIYTVTATKSGYIELIKTVTVTGPIQEGQGADIAMTEVMPPGEWQAQVIWAKHSEDIDSHSYFGDAGSTHVYWVDQGPITAFGTGGLTVTLDRDDVTGWGPETTTFKGVGDCKEPGKCLIVFKVKNYTPHDGDLGASQVKIKLFAGSQLGNDFEVPTSVGSDDWYSVFTIDARAAKAYAGEWHDGPYVPSTPQITNWYQSMDWNTWSHSPHGSVMAGFYRTEIGGLSKISQAKYFTVKSSAEVSCTKVHVDFSGTEEKWGLCPEGEYLNGFLRGGSNLDQKSGASELTGISCCKVAGLTEAYGTCLDIPVDDKGWTQCNAEEGGKVTTDSPSFLVGMHRNQGDEDSRLDSVRCCQFPDVGLVEGPAQTSGAEEGEQWEESWSSSWYSDQGEVATESYSTQTSYTVEYSSTEYSSYSYYYYR